MSSGRGKLLEQLRNLTLTDDSGLPVDESKKDSDEFKDATSSSGQSGSGRGSGGRGSNEFVPPRARGRASFLIDIVPASESGISDSTSVASTIDPMPMGRGRLFAQLAALRDDVSSVTASAVEEEVAQPIPEEAPEEKELETAYYRGEKGTFSKVAVNYIRLTAEPDKGVFEYEVRFNPPVVTMGLRYKLLNQMKDVIGPAKTFDGVTLYLPIKLEQIYTVATAQDRDGNKYEVTVIYKRQKKLRECIHLYNVLFDRVMKILKYVRYNRKQFDPTKPMLIPQHKLEIWPGYVTAVDEYENGLMLCIDVSFRVLNTRTVLDLLKEAYASSRDNYKANFEKAILGAVILTRYNNKTYRVDEVLWDMTPQSTFEAADGTEKTYCDYYRSIYDIEIRDMKQPLLLHTEAKRISGKTEPVEMRLCFIPELSYLTGLTDAMRADFKIMKDVATHTRITPNQRANSLRTFLKSVDENDDAKNLFKQWGLQIDADILRLEARTMQAETIVFGNKTVNVGPQADFNRDLCNNSVITPIDMKKWLLIYSKRDSNIAKKFVELATRNSRPMGIEVNQPTIVELPNDTVDAYVGALRKNLVEKFQIVVTICPTARDDRYAAIKRVCCSEIPVASQVINARTLNDDRKARGITQKIVLQMTAKMGGELWSIKIPFKNVMIVGIDSYHEAGARGNSVAAFVASLNGSYTRWYSRAVIQSKKEEVMNGLTVALVNALVEYKKINGETPSRIIIFRDGVGDGQLGWVKDYELPQLCTAFKSEGINPEFAYVVCQKNINTRIMLDKNGSFDNPLPGTVIDHSVTRKHLYDFFVVPQSVRQGTVTPTHFIVLQDTAKMAPDIMQRLAYKLCFMYYNWPGTVRVPAPCQYAHKLAQLVGCHVKRQTHDSLADKLFYL